MQVYEYVFRWMDLDPVVEKTVYAESLEGAKIFVKENWPELDPENAQVERIKGNGEPDLPLPGA